MRDEVRRREMRKQQRQVRRLFTAWKMQEEKLQGAKNWGIFDMLGGGFFTDMVKHSKMSDATAYMEDAKSQLLVFQRELRDVQFPLTCAWTSAHF